MRWVLVCLLGCGAATPASNEAQEPEPEPQAAVEACPELAQQARALHAEIQRERSTDVEEALRRYDRCLECCDEAVRPGMAFLRAELLNYRYDAPPGDVVRAYALAVSLLPPESQMAADGIYALVAAMKRCPVCAAEPLDDTIPILLEHHAEARDTTGAIFSAAEIYQRAGRLDEARRTTEILVLRDDDLVRDVGDVRLGDMLRALPADQARAWAAELAPRITSQRLLDVLAPYLSPAAADDPQAE